ncbi:MAG: winged helix-turn-helix transcriptional regulator [Clostridia bacterium]|nr:winged helix-turn-helix transcriptional regulator [Clostridia bacterium]
MAGAYIMTEDKNLYRWLTLLLEEAQMPLTDSHSATLFLVDLDTCPQKELPSAALGFSRKKTEAPFPVLLRPFDEEAVLRFLRSHREETPFPAFTPTEELLFTLLKEAKGEPVSARELLLKAFGEEEAENIGLLHVYIHYLRKKTESDGKKRIFAHRGKGYSYKDVDHLP